MSSTDDAEDITGRASVVSTTSSTDGDSSTVSSEDSRGSTRRNLVEGDDKTESTCLDISEDQSKDPTDRDNNNIAKQVRNWKLLFTSTI